MHYKAKLMKHIFVVNPAAGGEDKSPYIAQTLNDIDADTELYVTQAPLDATRYVRERCQEAGDEALRFYACGGDGTLNEVVAGAVPAAAGGRAVAVGCVPYGSGNDFVKYWPDRAFSDLAAQVAGEPVAVDVMRLGDRCCINTLNFGFEAEVCRTMTDVRRKPLIGGRMAYTTGIVKSLATGRRTPCRITVDGELWHDGDLLLANLANGMYAGGGYRCAPRAVVDDGWLEAMAIGPMSIARFARMIGSYERGTHLDDPRLSDVLAYRRGRRVRIESAAPFYIAIDGELLCGHCFDIECLPRALRFIVPDKLLQTED